MCHANELNAHTYSDRGSTALIDTDLYKGLMSPNKVPYVQSRCWEIIRLNARANQLIRRSPKRIIVKSSV